MGPIRSGAMGCPAGKNECCCAVLAATPNPRCARASAYVSREPLAGGMRRDRDALARAIVIVAHIDPQPTGPRLRRGMLDRPSPGGSTGTVVSSPWIFSAAKTDCRHDRVEQPGRVADPVA